MLPVFQTEGKVFVEMLKLKICVKIGTIVWPASFNSRAVMPSTPHEREGESLVNNFVTWSILVGLNWKIGGFALLSHGGSWLLANRAPSSTPTLAK